MGRRRRGLVALSVLGVAIAHCAALEPPRRLISFDEAHSIAADAEETAREAVGALVSSVASTLSGGETSETDDATTPATTAPVSITITIGGSGTGESNADTRTSEGGGSETYSRTDAPTATTRVAKRPTTTTPTATTIRRQRTRAPTTPSSNSRHESTSRDGADSAAPTAAPALATQKPTTLSSSTPTISLPTQVPPTPVTESPVSTQAPVSSHFPNVSVSTETPETVVSTTAPTTLTPDAVDTSATTSPVSGYEQTTHSRAENDGTDGPATDASGSTGAVVIRPGESTVIPLTSAPPASEAVSTNKSSETVGQATEVPATWSPSSGSSRSNDTVQPVHGGGGTSEGTTPGLVHASSSIAESSDGSSQSQSELSKHDDKNEKKKKGKHSSSDGSSRSDNNGKSTSASSSNSGSSGPGDGYGILNPGGVSDVNTSSATYYSLGTGSIVAIVGVIAGIMGILVLFVAIGRKKYSDEDDESPLPFGYDMQIRSVARLSPTFMQEDSFMESGYNINNTALMVQPLTQFDAASSSAGESADEVPSLRYNMMAPGAEDTSIRSRVPSVQSFSGDGMGVRMSTLYSRSSLTSGSGISGSWSSVLASDTERQPSRNTRDTTLSAWSAANLSSFGSTASGGSAFRMTRSSSTDLRHTGGSDHHDPQWTSQWTTGSTTSTYPTTADVESNRSNKSTEV